MQAETVVPHASNAASATPSGNEGLQSWTSSLVENSLHTKCTTIGLTSGSRNASDRCVIDSIASELCSQLKSRRAHHRMLLLRLDVFPSTSLERQADQPAGIPPTTRSPIGNWSEVTIPVPVGRQACWSLEQFPVWLPEWKNHFNLVVIDLGAMHLLPSRSAGRLCDSCFVVLGPDASASHEWILQHIAWHDRSGSTICGSILATAAA